MHCHHLWFLAALLVGGCSTGGDVDVADAGGADLGTVDAARGADAGSDLGTVTDLGLATDAGGATDGAMSTDAGGSGDAGDAAGIGDAGATSDAGPVPDGGACVGETGLACDDTADGGTCAAGYSCDLGRCIPQARETCGGFAGAPCPATGHTDCLYETGHGDVGTCFTPAEHACLCAVAAATWCP